MFCFHNMNLQDKINQLKKLLKSLVFNKYDIDFDVIKYPNEDKNYLITINVDPYKYFYNFTGGNDEYWDTIETIDEKISNSLKYIGIDDFEIELNFKIEDFEQFKSEIISQIKNKWKTIEKIYSKKMNGDILPSLGNIQIYQLNSKTPNVEIVFGFTPEEIFDSHNLWNIIMSKLNFDDFLVGVEYNEK